MEYDVIDIPRFPLRQLKGDLRGFWAITVPANWRLFGVSKAPTRPTST